VEFKIAIIIILIIVLINKTPARKCFILVMKDDFPYIKMANLQICHYYQIYFQHLHVQIQVNSINLKVSYLNVYHLILLFLIDLLFSLSTFHETSE